MNSGKTKELYEWARTHQEALIYTLSSVMLLLVLLVGFAIFYVVRRYRNKKTFQIANLNGRIVLVGTNVKSKGCYQCNFGQKGTGNESCMEDEDMELQSCVFVDGQGQEIEHVQFSSIHSGASYTVFKTPDGKLYGCGLNENGTLGPAGEEGENEVIVNVTLLGGHEDVKKVACGGEFLLTLSKTGEVRQIGRRYDGYYGNIGIFPGCEKTDVPVLVDFDDLEEGESVDNIECGENYSLAKTNFGHAYSWGCPFEGALGREVNLSKELQLYLIPAKIPIDQRVLKIACGKSSSFFILENGEVKACGDNGYGQLGLDVYVGGNESDPIELRSANNVVRHPTLVPVPMEVEKIVGGERHTLFLGKDKRLLSCGSNVFGQLGNGTLASSWDKETGKNSFITIEFPKRKEIKEVDMNCIVDILSDDDNDDTDDNEVAVPVQPPVVVSKLCARSHYCAALMTDGSCYHWGLMADYRKETKMEEENDTKPMEKLPKKIDDFADNDVVIDITCGDNHTSFLLA